MGNQIMMARTRHYYRISCGTLGNIVYVVTFILLFSVLMYASYRNLMEAHVSEERLEISLLAYAFAYGLILQFPANFLSYLLKDLCNNKHASSMRIDVIEGVDDEG